MSMSNLNAADWGMIRFAVRQMRNKYRRSAQRNGPKQSEYQYKAEWYQHILGDIKHAGTDAEPDENGDSPARDAACAAARAEEEDD